MTYFCTDYFDDVAPPVLLEAGADYTDDVAPPVLLVAGADYTDDVALPVLLGCWELLLGGRWGVLLLLLGFPELLLAGLLVLLGFACVARGVDSLFQERQVFVTP